MNATPDVEIDGGAALRDEGADRRDCLCGRCQPDRRRTKRALSLSERGEISRRLSMRRSLRSIARHLGRSASTISREVQRNGGADRYRAARSELPRSVEPTAQSGRSHLASVSRNVRAEAIRLETEHDAGKSSDIQRQLPISSGSKGCGVRSRPTTTFNDTGLSFRAVHEEDEMLAVDGIVQSCSAACGRSNSDILSICARV
ncbi:hypothetical protein V1282_003893 [Nitrobacteraceae bacterium AZCC 2146]